MKSRRNGFGGPRRPRRFCIGDTATINAWAAVPCQALRRRAKKMGSQRRANHKRRSGRTPRSRPFRYRDSAISRPSANGRQVIDFGWIKIRGRFASWIGGMAHNLFWIGFANRLGRRVEG